MKITSSRAGAGAAPVLVTLFVSPTVTLLSAGQHPGLATPACNYHCHLYTTNCNAAYVGIVPTLLWFPPHPSPQIACQILSFLIPALQLQHQIMLACWLVSIPVHCALLSLHSSAINRIVSLHSKCNGRSVTSYEPRLMSI